MTNNDWMLWNAKPRVPDKRETPREWLYAVRRDNHALECELLYNGEFSVEARWLLDGELSYARVFVSKALAVAWAESTRDDHTRKGWLLLS